jgi:hypothetical protein
VDQRDPFASFRSRCKQSTSRAYDLHREAIDKSDWLAAGVWGAIFLESFLDDVCSLLQLKVNGAELNDYISRLRGAVKDRPNVRELVGYCETLRAARNGLMHAREDFDPKAPANTIRDYLPKILALTRQWFVDAGSQSIDSEAKLPEPIGRVFVSTITPHLVGQEAFLRDLGVLLRQNALEMVRVKFDSYDAKDPVAKVAATLKTCDAFLAVGLSRSHSYYLKDREGSSKEVEFTHRFYTSGWLHLEAGVAYGVQKPVFVLCEPNLAADGIFDKAWNSSPPFELSVTPASIDDPVVKECIARVHAEVERLRASHGASNSEQSAHDPQARGARP